MMGGWRPLRERTVVTFDHDFTHLVSLRMLNDVTLLVEFTDI